MKTAQYVKSSVSLAQCPRAKLPEFAVIGRSNVGKSSLINMLTGQATLAKVSKTPGEDVGGGIHTFAGPPDSSLTCDLHAQAKPSA